MFAISAHNVTVERIFSLIKAQWTDERNCMLVETVKYLLIVKFNFRELSCLELLAPMSKNVNVRKSVSNNSKYSFLKKSKYLIVIFNGSSVNNIVIL